MSTLFRKTITLMAVVAMSLGIVGVADATLIFSADTANTTLTNNNNNVSGGMTLTGATPNLLLANSNGNFNTGGFASTDDINTLNGAALTDDDTVVICVTVDSVTHTAASELRSRGFEFGMAANPNFDGRDSMGNQNSDSLILTMGGAANSGNVTTNTPNSSNSFVTVTNGSTIDQASLEDGFTVTLTADAAGFTYSFTSLTSGAAPLADVTGTFAAGDFVNYFGTGHFYASAQKRLAGTTTTDISKATIDVTTVPEPSSLFLLGVLSTAGLLIRRRYR